MNPGRLAMVGGQDGFECNVSVLRGECVSGQFGTAENVKRIYEMRTRAIAAEVNLNMAPAPFV